MKNKNNLIISICWLINLLVLLVIILIPKDNNLFRRLYVLFMLCIFLFPAILIFAQTFIKFKEKEPITLWNTLPCLGSSLIILLTFVKFIGSMEKIAVFQMIVITLTFILLEGLIAFIINKYREMSKKQYIFINIAIYISLALFFFCAMIMSIDYSTIW